MLGLKLKLGSKKTAAQNEIVSSWILSAGAWNDSGFWTDSETWKDS